MRSLSILLGSASPRRRSLLEALGHRVTVAPADVDEAEIAGEAPVDYLARVVARKLAVALERAGERLAAHDALLVADTVVVLPLGDDARRGRILQKPADPADGAAMLRALSGRAHHVITRFAIATARGARWSESVGTVVEFRALDDQDVDQYVASGEGVDKAGGYAIQGRGAGFVRRIDGSYGAVVGLPSCEVELALRSVTAADEPSTPPWAPSSRSR